MNDKSQVKSEPIEQLRDWCKNSNRRAPFDDIIGAIEAYDTLKSQLTQAQSERDMANAGWAALKMCAQTAKGSEAFEKCFLEIVQLSGHGQALLERMKEAEWLLSRPLLPTMSKQSELTEYHRRYDAFQKGGVK